MFLQQILKQMRKAGDVLAAGNPLRSPSFRNTRADVTGGGQVGYNLQFNQFVVGVEADRLGFNAGDATKAEEQGGNNCAHRELPNSRRCLGRASIRAERLTCAPVVRTRKTLRNGRA